VTFARNFKRRFGSTPAHYRLNWRLHRAARLLWSRAAARVADIAGECGFHHMSFFHGLFRSRFGMAPAEWRRDRAAA
jgi:transcriptional regulator GlxA family with amidase domain